MTPSLIGRRIKFLKISRWMDNNLRKFQHSALAFSQTPNIFLRPNVKMQLRSFTDFCYLIVLLENAWKLFKWKVSSHKYMILYILKVLHNVIKQTPLEAHLRKLWHNNVCNKTSQTEFFHIANFLVHFQSSRKKINRNQFAK